MAGFGGIRKGRREAVENLGFEEGEIVQDVVENPNYRP